MWFGLYLYRHGLITAEQFVDALARQHRTFTPLGQLALQAQLINVGQLFEILASQVDKLQPFGVVAREKGYVDESDLAHLLIKQSESVKPLHEILVEMEVLPQNVMEQHLAAAYAETGRIADQEQALGN